MLMVWIEMGFVDLVLRWIVFGWLKYVELSNGLGWSGFYVNTGLDGLGWVEWIFCPK